MIFETEAGAGGIGGGGARGRVGAGADRSHRFEAFGDVDFDLCLAAIGARALLRAEIDAGCDVTADLQCRAAIRPSADRQLFKPEALADPAKRIAAARRSAAQLGQRASNCRELERA